MHWIAVVVEDGWGGVCGFGEMNRKRKRKGKDR